MTTQKQHLRTNHIQHCSLMDPMRVGMLEQSYILGISYLFVYITWYYPLEGEGWRCQGQVSIVSPICRIITRSSAFPYDSDSKPC
jgi:hypothetical protein